ncbi:MAG: hypothetical protein HLUCCO16_13160 [Phormidium sp. OSCR]|nr:MAG: hypothetical protein HLUCCO16_13160 [Phormidium sp. OSCR]
MFYFQMISIHGGQAIAETPILSWSATYLPPSRGLSGSGGLLLAFHSQLFGVILDPLGSMGLECGRGAGSMSLPSPFLRKRNEWKPLR